MRRATVARLRAVREGAARGRPPPSLVPEDAVAVQNPLMAAQAPRPAAPPSPRPAPKPAAASPVAARRGKARASLAMGAAVRLQRARREQAAAAVTLQRVARGFLVRRRADDTRHALLAAHAKRRHLEKRRTVIRSQRQERSATRIQAAARRFQARRLLPLLREEAREAAAARALQAFARRAVGRRRRRLAAVEQAAREAAGRGYVFYSDSESDSSEDEDGLEDVVSDTDGEEDDEEEFQFEIKCLDTGETLSVDALNQQVEQQKQLRPIAEDSADPDEPPAPPTPSPSPPPAPVEDPTERKLDDAALAAHDASTAPPNIRTTTRDDDDFTVCTDLTQHTDSPRGGRSPRKSKMSFARRERRSSFQGQLRREGWLKKRSRRLGTLQERWVRLVGGFVIYSKKPSASAYDGYIDLRAATKIVLVDSDVAVVANARTFAFTALSPKDAAAWHRAMTEGKAEAVAAAERRLSAIPDPSETLNPLVLPPKTKKASRRMSVRKRVAVHDGEEDDYPGVAAKQGVMRKRSRKGVWQTRWFSARRGTLSYSKEAGSPTLGAIRVVDVRSAEVSDRFGELRLELRGGGRPEYVLRAADAEEAAEWVANVRARRTYALKLRELGDDSGPDSGPDEDLEQDEADAGAGAPPTSGPLRKLVRGRYRRFQTRHVRIERGLLWWFKDEAAPVHEGAVSLATASVSVSGDTEFTLTSGPLSVVFDAEEAVNLAYWVRRIRRAKARGEAREARRREQEALAATSVHVRAFDADRDAVRAAVVDELDLRFLFTDQSPSLVVDASTQCLEALEALALECQADARDDVFAFHRQLVCDRMQAELAGVEAKALAGELAAEDHLLLIEFLGGFRAALAALPGGGVALEVDEAALVEAYVRSAGVAQRLQAACDNAHAHRAPLGHGTTIPVDVFSLIDDLLRTVAPSGSTLLMAALLQSSLQALVGLFSAGVECGEWEALVATVVDVDKCLTELARVVEEYSDSAHTHAVAQAPTDELVALGHRGAAALAALVLEGADTSLAAFDIEAAAARAADARERVPEFFARRMLARGVAEELLRRFVHGLRPDSVDAAALERMREVVVVQLRSAFPAELTDEALRVVTDLVTFCQVDVESLPRTVALYAESRGAGWARHIEAAAKRALRLRAGVSKRAAGAVVFAPDDSGADDGSVDGLYAELYPAVVAGGGGRRFFRL